MAVWAIADLHLSFGVPDKAMDIFGEEWASHAAKIEKHWRSCVTEEDLVLIPGDISWAMRLEDALKDLEWIHELPGHKVILRGNHDYWWTSKKKMQAVMPPSIEFIQNDSVLWQDIGIAGCRLWDSSEYRFQSYIQWKNHKKANLTSVDHDRSQSQQIFKRELARLELSLKSLAPHCRLRIAMTHYPPIGADLKPSQTSALLEQYRINFSLFGHLHSLKPDLELFGEKNGIHYLLSSCDYLDFAPIRVC